MKRFAKLDKQVAYRWKLLGDIGEKLTESLLIANGFTNVRNLNRDKTNFPYADFYAERDDVKFVISVKARNRYEFNCDGKRRLNCRYKLGRSCYELAKAAEAQFHATAAWLTISVDSERYSAYFGLLSSLNGNRGVNMSLKAIASYECLANEARHTLNYAELKNTYEIAG